MGNAFLDELEKIANDLIDEPMNPDMQPVVTEDEVADTQMQNEDQSQEYHQEIGNQEQLQPSEAEVTDAILNQAIEEEAAAQQMIPEEQMQQEVPEQQELQQVPQELPEQQAPPQEANPQQIVEGAEQGIPQDEEALLAAMQEEEQVASDVAEVLQEKVAQELIALATIAKIAECARGGEGVSDDLHKEAHAIAEAMVQDVESFDSHMERVASEMFAIEENVTDLFTPAGLGYVFEQLASLESEGLEKQADEEGNAVSRLSAFASDAIRTAKDKVMEAASSAVNLKQISAELEQATKEIEPAADMYKNFSMEAQAMIDPAERAEFHSKVNRIQQLENQQKSGRIGAGVGLGLAAAGAAYGGKKLYDYTHQEQEEEKTAGVLPDAFTDGTLNAVNENDYTGGITEMSKELVNEFLKVAGAAGLITVVNGEEYDMEFRKEASAAFDEIATMSTRDMDEALVKVAQELYSEDELHEIVAGNHTEELFDKVAYFVEAADASYDEVFEKVANAGGVAATQKIGAGLKKAQEVIVPIIDKAKAKTEAAGRGYIGVLKGENGKGAQAGGIAATGLAGGGLVGAGAMAGYNVINNPGEYDIEQTAAAYEEAVLAKQAAVEAYAAADQFTKQFSHLFAQK